MSSFIQAIGRALDMLAEAANDTGFKKPWLLAFTAKESGIFVEAMDIEMTPADESAEPLLVLEAAGSPQEVRQRFLAAWATVPPLSDHHGRAVSAAYEDSVGVGSNEGGSGWSWQTWDQIE